MDRPWQIDWSGGKIVLHASSSEEATRKVLEYLKAMNPFRVEAIKDGYDENYLQDRPGVVGGNVQKTGN